MIPESDGLTLVDSQEQPSVIFDDGENRSTIDQFGRNTSLKMRAFESLCESVKMAVAVFVC